MANKQEIFTTTATLGIIKSALKKVVDGYDPQVCDPIIANRTIATIKERENKEPHK